MKEDIKVQEFYQQKIDSLEQQLKILYKKRSAIAWIRFAIFITTCLGIYFLWSSGLLAITIAVIWGIALFLIAVSKDTDNKNTIKNLETLLSINKDEINYLHQNFSNKYDGKNLEPPHHAYAKDLDVFGQSSLFQYINRCNAEQAIILFAERLLKPLNKEKILHQQNAIKEISSKINWWQQFQAFGLMKKLPLIQKKK